MHTAELLKLFARLQEERVPFIVVGGYAVIAHGHVRTTLDLDIVVDFAHAAGLVSALKSLNYQPRVPVNLDALADPVARRSWIEEKQAQVFTVVKKTPHAECDIFLREPFSFTAAYEDALLQQMPGLNPVRIVDFQRLIHMKEEAARPKDLADIAALKDRAGSS